MFLYVSVLPYYLLMFYLCIVNFLTIRYLEEYTSVSLFVVYIRNVKGNSISITILHEGKDI